MQKKRRLFNVINHEYHCDIGEVDVVAVGEIINDEVHYDEITVTSSDNDFEVLDYEPNMEELEYLAIHNSYWAWDDE